MPSPGLIRLLLILPLLAGCAGKPLSQADRQAASNPAQAVRAARQHQRQGDWAAALKLLRSAAKQNPQDESLKQALTSLQAAWQDEATTLRQRLLIDETRSLLKQLPLREALVKGDPSDLASQTGLVAHELRLKSRIQPLRDCGRYQSERRLQLARDCLKYAQRLAPDIATGELLAEVESRYQKRLTQWRASRAARLQREQQQQRERLLDSAEQALRKGNSRQAGSLLDQVLAADPDNSRATELMYQVQSNLNRQIEALLKLGDSLYREGRLDAAITAWSTLLKLSPGEAQASARIERAQKVQKKLELLRTSK